MMTVRQMEAAEIAVKIIEDAANKRVIISQRETTKYFCDKNDVINMTVKLFYNLGMLMEITSTELAEEVLKQLKGE